MEIVSVAVLVVAAVAMIAYSLWPAKSEKDGAVERRLVTAGKDRDSAALMRAAKEAAAKASMFARAAPLLSKPMMPKSAEESNTLRMKLANAGFRRENAPLMFLASKTALGAAFGLLVAFYALSAGKQMTSILGLGAFAAGIGFLGPNGWLWLAIHGRSEKIRNGLPDSLDLLVVSVEAGLGLDAAVQRVGDEMRHVYPELSEEMQIATVETQMGVPRSEALTRMGDRTGVVEMKSLVAVISQAEKLGTSVAKALRNQAEALRTKRRQRAEERAQKTAVKLLLPLIVFIFPAIMVVLGGPAAIKLMETLGGGGSGNLKTG